MIEIYPKIFLLKGYCNAYYLDCEVKALIDAGADFEGKVDILILTHIHPDHIFFANKIQKRTGCKILIGKGDDKINELVKFFPKWEGKKIEKFNISKSLADGEEINLGEYSLKIIFCPGHTLGGISLYEKKHKLLFSGDTIFNDGFIGRTDLFHSNEKAMQKTLKNLKKIKFKHLFAGHGRV